ncbi:hypothetical protein ACHQM5_023676 [Ranunculus cassubicifolius]
MLHRAASNAYSWWWASHIRTKQSKWLDNNLQEMEEKVQYMLKLIDEDGDSFAKRAESYYRKRPELIGFVEEFYRAYRAMAERYDHISGELQNANHTIATVFPEQVQFAMDEEDETSSPKMPPPRQIDPSKVPKDLPEVPKIAIPDFLKHLKKDKSGPGGPPKRMQSKKTSAPVIPSSGLSKTEAIEEIDKLQKGILALQTEKEFVKSSYENRLSKYWEIEKAITEMQEKVCGLQDEFNVGTLIDDNEARSLMASTALKSCQETLVQLQEKQARSNEEAKMEYERVKSAHEKLVALKGEFLPNETHQMEFISESSSLKLSEEESRDLQKEILDAESIREKIREHFEMNSGSSLTVPELAEKIDELVTKVISLETAVSTQTALINRLRSETDDLQENLRNLEEDKAALLQDSNKLSEKLKEVEGELNLVHDLNRSVENQNNNLQTHFTEAHCNLDHLSEKLKSVKPLEEEVENTDPQKEEAGSFFGKKPEIKHEEQENVMSAKPLNEEIEITGSSQGNPNMISNARSGKEHEKESSDVMVQREDTMKEKEKEAGAGTEEGRNMGLEQVEVAKESRDVMTHTEHQEPKDMTNEKVTGAEEVRDLGLELEVEHGVPSESVNQKEKAGAKEILNLGLELPEHEKVPAVFVNEKETGQEKIQGQGLELAEHEKVPVISVNEKETGAGAEKVQGQDLELAEHEKVPAVSVNGKGAGAGAENVQGQGLELTEHEKVPSLHVNEKEKAAGARAEEGWNLGLELTENKKVPAEPVIEKEKAAGAEKAQDQGLEPAEPNSSRSIPDDIFRMTLYPKLLGDDGKQESPTRNDSQDNTEAEEDEFPDQEEPNWQQLFLSGLDDRERMLLGEYTSILRKYKETRRQLSELQMKNNDAQFEAMVQLRELKSAIAMKDEEIQSLRQKLKIMQESENSNELKSHEPQIDSLQEKSHDMSKEGKETTALLSEHAQASDLQDRNVEAEPKPNDVPKEVDEEDVIMVIPKEDRAVSTLEEKFRRDIDELLEENLEFWLRFSGLFQEIQKFQTSIEDLQSDYKKLKGQKNLEDSTSSRHTNSLKSDARPIYKHLREIQTELTVWIEKNMLLKDELQYRLSSLRNIQEEISRVSKTSSGTDVEFTSYQAAKFQGEVLNMQQENNKVADELQAGLEHVKGLQVDVEKSLLQMDEELKLSGSRNHHHVIHSLSRTRIPLRSFLFGVKSKKQKPSLFACINPTLQKNYSDLHQGHVPT